MRVVTQEKLSLMLVGLPRSGTTIAARVLNSFDNAFFIAGALLNFHEFGKRDYPLIGLIESEYELVKKILSVDADMVGTKENFWIKNVHLRNFNHFDRTVFIFREPKACFASWKRDYYIKNPIPAILDPVAFVASYNGLMDVRKSLATSRSFIYEDFCEHPLEVLQEACGVEFEGDLQLTPMHEGTKGDDRARESQNITSARVSFDELKPEEVDYVDEHLASVWESLKDECRSRSHQRL